MDRSVHERTIAIVPTTREPRADGTFDIDRRRRRRVLRVKDDAVQRRNATESDRATSGSLEAPADDRSDRRRADVHCVAYRGMIA